MMVLGLFLAVLFLAYANGANDNFKGVATLYGSGTLGYRQSLTLATLATMAGSLCSLILAEELVRNFSGKGLVPDAVAASPDFLLSVALGAGAVVFLAARMGFPISTTHALTGALTGAGLAAAGTSEVHYAKLGMAFFLPLAISPFLALSLSASGYAVLRRLRKWAGLKADACACITDGVECVPSAATSLSMSMSGPRIVMGSTEACDSAFGGAKQGVTAETLRDAGHVLSAALVSFARGLNDTPKLFALLAVFTMLGMRMDLGILAMAMALGGILGARKVALTMSRKITSMEHGPAFSANVATAFLILGASHLGFPVSTTHVSVGAISGVGLVTGKADFRVLGGIALSWLLTLPVAGVLAYLCRVILGN